MRYLFLLWYCLVKHFNDSIQFLLKISLIWWDKFIYNFKYIFINKTCLIKNNYNSCGQINKKYSFTWWGGLRGAPRSRDGVKKISPLCGTRRRWDKTKPCRLGVKTPSFGPAPPRPIAIFSNVSEFRFYFLKFMGVWILHSKVLDFRPPTFSR